MGWKKIPKKFQQMLKSGIFKKNIGIFGDFQHLLKFFWDFFSTQFFGIFEIARQLSTFWLRWINYNFQNDWAMAILQKPFCPVRKLKMWRLIIRAPYAPLTALMNFIELPNIAFGSYEGFPPKTQFWTTLWCFSFGLFICK